MPRGEQLHKPMKSQCWLPVLRWLTHSSKLKTYNHCASVQKQRESVADDNMTHDRKSHGMFVQNRDVSSYLQGLGVCQTKKTPRKAASQSCKSSSKGHAQPPPCNFVEAGNRPDEFTAARSGQAIEKVLTMRPSFSSSSLASYGRSSFDSSASSSFDQPSTDSAFHHSRNSLFKPVRALAANDERMRLLPSPKTIPPTRCSTSPKLAPAGLRQRTSGNSQVQCPEEHPETGLSSQVAADKKMLLSGRRLRPVSKTERVAMSYWLTSLCPTGSYCSCLQEHTRA